MMENGSGILAMVLVFKFGQMGLNTKENGEAIKLTERESSGMLTEIILKDIGRMTKQTAMAFIFIPMEQNMRVIGKTIFRMDLELKHGISICYLFEGLTDLATKVTISMAKKKAWEFTTGMMGQNI